MNTRPARRSHVMGPDGDVLTIADLPPRDTVRWVPHRKARLVAAVCGGLISLSEACARYSLSPEEFASWKNALEEKGMRGLQVTKSRPRKPAHPGNAAGAQDGNAVSGAF